VAIAALLAGAALATATTASAASTKLPPRTHVHQHGGALPTFGRFIARQPTEANPFRIDSSRDHGPRRYSGSRLYVPTPDWDR
jgi:hypothetical protein